MMFASYVLGQKHYPVPYDLGKIGMMIGTAVLLYWGSVVMHISDMQYGLVLNVLFLLGYLAVSFLMLRPNFK
jgi:hypothetical protein